MQVARVMVDDMEIDLSVGLNDLPIDVGGLETVTSRLGRIRRVSKELRESLREAGLNVQFFL
jgi:hypothetical protein